MKVTLTHEVALDHKHGIIDLWKVTAIIINPETKEETRVVLGECTADMIKHFQDKFGNARFGFGNVRFEVKPSQSVIRFNSNYVVGITPQ